ncbi:hypothetical protein ACFQ36_07070 [Arthrobacter sp. GCM10027362]|uniref:hypothetical protein n=1 Tax=Arthrobacter sp. GCM10027362 TaxID=3273379 RepID=UPI0036390FA2
MSGELAGRVYRDGTLPLTLEQIQSVLDAAGQHAVIVPLEKVPDAYFGVHGGEPVAIISPPRGGHGKAVPFNHSMLSGRRALTAVREALGVLKALRADQPYLRERYEEARDVYLRRHLEREHVDDGGAQTLAGGAL